jgi:hypothetical protein
MAYATAAFVFYRAATLRACSSVGGDALLALFTLHMLLDRLGKSIGA